MKTDLVIFLTISIALIESNSVLAQEEYYHPPVDASTQQIDSREVKCQGE